MSVTNENVKETYNGNGSTIHWPITFEYADPNHIAVYLTDDDGVTGDKLESDYTVDEENKRVIYPDPLNEELILPEGWKITLKRETPLIQNYQPSTQSFNPADIEPALDKTMMAIAEIKEENDRAVKRSIIDDTDYTLPVAVPKKVLGWNDDGTGLVNYTNPDAAVAEAEAFAVAAGEAAEAAAGSASMAVEAEETIRGIVYHGWVSGLTAVYVSSNKIKIEGLDVTDRIQKGTKIRYKQGGDWKYGVVFADVEFSTDSIISLTGGSDYEVEDAEITDFYFSNIENPIGWPGVFNWTPVVTFDRDQYRPEITVTECLAQFQVSGSCCEIFFTVSGFVTYDDGDGSINMSLPIPALVGHLSRKEMCFASTHLTHTWGTAKIATYNDASLEVNLEEGDFMGNHSYTFSGRYKYQF